MNTLHTHSAVRPATQGHFCSPARTDCLSSGAQGSHTRSRPRHPHSIPPRQCFHGHANMCTAGKEWNTITRAAFTLIEILVVIAIIAILASLLLVGGSMALKTKSRLETEHRINNLCTAIEFYFPHIRNFQHNEAGPFDLPDYVQMLGKDRFEEKAGNLLLVSNGTWGPANLSTATHLKDGFHRPIWIQVVNRETPNRANSFYTALIAIRSYGPNDDPVYNDDIVMRYDTERLVWEKCKMTGYNGTEWILETKK